MTLNEKDDKVLTELDLQFFQLEKVIIAAENVNGKDIVQGIELIRNIVTTISSIGDKPNEYRLIKTLISRFIKNYKDLYNGSDDPITKGLIMGENLVEQYYTCIDEVQNEWNISNR